MSLFVDFVRFERLAAIPCEHIEECGGDRANHRVARALLEPLLLGRARLLREPVHLRRDAREDLRQQLGAQARAAVLELLKRARRRRARRSRAGSRRRRPRPGRR